MTYHRLLTVLAACSALAAGLAACDSDDGQATTDDGVTTATTQAGDSAGSELSGKITVEGSATVAPFAQAAAQLFNEDQPRVEVTVGGSGTGAGFASLCGHEADIAGVARPMDEDEAASCKKADVEYGQVQVANDGIAVVTNKQLAVDCLTTDELRQLWDRGSRVATLRTLDSALSDTKLTLFGPDAQSGAFDFFTAQINGRQGRARDDYEPSPDGNQLVAGVAADEGGLGYFPFPYYEANRGSLNLVGVDAGQGCVKPSREGIQDNSYAPLSRPLFLYPRAASLRRPEVKAFLEFVVDHQDAIAEVSHVVPLSDEQAAEARQSIRDAETK